MSSKTIPVENFDLVIFGGSGDLAKRKILPGLYRRMVAGQMPKDARIIGAARGEMTHDEYRSMIGDSLKDYVKDEKRNKENIEEFLAKLSYIQIDALGDVGWKALAKHLRKDVIKAFYFSVGPSLFGALADRLVRYKITDKESRIVVEKPFGRDLESARNLNAELAKCFEEAQLYRIDHYLGKETVQNLMAIRFANALFEPLWNSQHIDHVQITVAENLSVAGRGGYYDRSGAIRDMVQNHLMQLLCLTAMEPPSKFDPDAVRDEKLKVIRALEPVSDNDVVRGQYLGTGNDGSYIEDSENPDSRTESFVAMRVNIANWRWAGVPFYLRTGKRLRERVSEIAIKFKGVRHSIFEGASDPSKGNALIIRLQPDEGITMRVTIKEPGPGGMRLAEVPLDMTFAETLGDVVEEMPDAYERLIMDVIRGNQTLFMRGDEVEAAWEWIDPVIKSWEESNRKPEQYDPLSSGPEESFMLMHKDGRRWRDITL